MADYLDSDLTEFIRDRMNIILWFLTEWGVSFHHIHVKFFLSNFLQPAVYLPLFLQRHLFLPGQTELFCCLTTDWWQIYFFLSKFSESWRIDGSKGRTEIDNARKEFILLVFDSRSSPGRWYFKVRKTSWKFPEFLQRRRSIDQNNQEKGVHQMPLTW